MIVVLCVVLMVLMGYITVFCTSRFVFGATSLLPLITSVVSVLVKEQPVRGPARGLSLGNGFIESSKNNFTQLWGAVKQPSVLLPTLFIFLWQATPQSDSAMFYFTYVQFRV